MKRLSSIVRWAARILSLLSALSVVFMATGDRLPDAVALGVDEKALIASLLLMVLGALAAWKWELIGGITIFIGFGLLWYLNGTLPNGSFSLFPAAACSYLIAWLLDHPPVDEPPPKSTKKKSAARTRR